MCTQQAERHMWCLAAAAAGRRSGALHQAAAPLMHTPTAYPPLPACLSPEQVFDDYLRKRAANLGAKVVNGLYMGLEQQGDGPITIRYNEYKEGACGRMCCGGESARLWVLHANVWGRESVQMGSWACQWCGLPCLAPP